MTRNCRYSLSCHYKATEQQRNTHRNISIYWTRSRVWRRPEELLNNNWDLIFFSMENISEFSQLLISGLLLLENGAGWETKVRVAGLSPDLGRHQGAHLGGEHSFNMIQTLGTRQSFVHYLFGYLTFDVWNRRVRNASIPNNSYAKANWMFQKVLKLNIHN